MPRDLPERDGRRALLGWAAYLTVSVVWGSTFLGIAVALRSFTPWGVVSVRFTVASILCLALGRLLGEARPSRAVAGHLAVSGAVLLGVCNAIVTWAELHVPSGLAAVLCAPVPIVLALLSLRTERLGARGWAGVLLGFAGVVVLTAPERSAGASLAAAVGILLSTVLWAWATLHMKRHVSGGGPLTNAGIQMATAAGIALLAAGPTGGFLRAPLAPEAVGALLYLAVVGSCLAFTAFGVLTRLWPPARAGTYAYLNPAIAVLLGAALLGEPLGLRLLLGMAVLLAGVALVQIRRRD
ncbi:MAG TPA: EamA family transporter [Thermoanaerobaculia bacterium]|nr:EamA family transporter [Thermoanaerobaculia bacterium]